MFLASTSRLFEGVNAEDTSRILAREIREELESRQPGENRAKKEGLAVIDNLAV
jgi:hypothetical protein